MAQPPLGPARQPHDGTAPRVLPTAVIAGLTDRPAHGYLDRQGRYHSALAPFTVRSHWRAGEVGGPDVVGRNDRFSAPEDERYIDVIAVPNSQHVDSAQAQRTLWAYLVQMGMHPHPLGRMRVLGSWVPLLGLTSADTGEPHARLVFATTQYVWLIDLATQVQALPHDLLELVYLAGSFELPSLRRAE